MGGDIIAALAFCPGHISGYFKPEYSFADDAPGSVGGGIVIDRGVTASAQESERTRVTCIYTSPEGSVLKTIRCSPPVEYALEKAGIRAKVTTRTDLPPESGFGLSSAAIISSLAAGADATGIEIADDEIFRIAYNTETHFRTGLGDVPAVSGGGYVCRRKPGLGEEIIRRYDMDEPVYVLNFGSIPTAELLAEKEAVDRIKLAYMDSCPKTPEDFFRISRDFSERSGLITGEVRRALRICDREEIPASMTMLGNGVFAYGRDSYDLLAEFGVPEEVHMSKTGFKRGV